MSAQFNITEHTVGGDFTSQDIHLAAAEVHTWITPPLVGAMLSYLSIGIWKGLGIFPNCDSLRFISVPIFLWCLHRLYYADVSGMGVGYAMMHLDLISCAYLRFISSAEHRRFARPFLLFLWLGYLYFYVRLDGENMTRIFFPDNTQLEGKVLMGCLFMYYLYGCQNKTFFDRVLGMLNVIYVTD